MSDPFGAFKGQYPHRAPRPPARRSTLHPGLPKQDLPRAVRPVPPAKRWEPDEHLEADYEDRWNDGE